MDILWVVFSLIGVLGLFFVLIYALRKLNRGISVMSGGKMKIIDRVSVGRDGMLLVVSVAGKLMLVSATSQRIEKLEDLDMTAEEYAAQQNGAVNTGMSFGQALSAVMGRKKGEEKDNGNDYRDN
ncbi:MAG: FliO/MopB family protein [Ruminiclostridium sp.]